MRYIPEYVYDQLAIIRASGKIAPARLSEWRREPIVPIPCVGCGRGLTHATVVLRMRLGALCKRCWYRAIAAKEGETI